jgi:alpha-beta hydrolase superfamily lysophospholipase
MSGAAGSATGRAEHDDRAAASDATDRVELRHDGIVETPTWFGPDQRPLFGWFVYPEDQQVRGAVVLCQPLAEEGNMAYRTFRTLSQRLAQEGYLAFRFDYDGTGDSAGSFEDGDRAQSWMASVDHALAAVLACGADRISVVGMRMGAAIAHTALARSSADVQDLVLWDPVMAGRSFLREWQMIHAAWIADVDRAPEGWVETPSYRFTPEAAADVRSFSIRPTDAPIARRVLVLSRSDRKRDARLEQLIAGDGVEWAEVDDQAALLDVPTIDAAVPHDGVDKVVAALAAQAPQGTTGITVHARQVARWVESGVEVEESPGFFGRERIVFGMRTTSPAADPRLPVVLYVNIAAERHVGEGRSWLTLARRTAASGFSSVRVDHSGAGDSGIHPGQRLDRVCDAFWLDDVPEVAHELAADPSRDAIGVGLCSSGASVLEALYRGTLREAVAINVPFMIRADSSTPREWTVFRRMSRSVTKLAIRHRRTAWSLWRASSALDPRRAALWVPKLAVKQGSEVTLVVGDDDLNGMRTGRLWNATWGRSLWRSPRFRVVRAKNADHSLRVSSGQDEAMEIVVGRLDAIASERRGARASVPDRV